MTSKSNTAEQIEHFQQQIFELQRRLDSLQTDVRLRMPPGTARLATITHIEHARIDLHAEIHSVAHALGFEWRAPKHEPGRWVKLRSVWPF